MLRDDAEYRIRPAVEADQTGVLRCLAVAFEPYREQYTSRAYSDTVLNPVGYGERLRAMHVLVAASESGILGTISGACKGHEGHLRGMAVLAEWRGTGLAGRLLVAMENWMREQGCDRVTLDTTLPLKPAMRFYKKAGYVYSGKTSNFFGMQLLEYAKQL